MAASGEANATGKQSVTPFGASLVAWVYFGDRFFAFPFFIDRKMRSKKREREKERSHLGRESLPDEKASCTVIEDLSLGKCEFHIKCLCNSSLSSEWTNS